MSATVMGPCQNVCSNHIMNPNPSQTAKTCPCMECYKLTQLKTFHRLLNMILQLYVLSNKAIIVYCIHYMYNDMKKYTLADKFTTPKQKYIILLM